MKTILYKLKQVQAFIFLLPLFFVLHEFLANFHPALAGEASKQLILNIIASILIATLVNLYVKDFRKACLVAFGVMSFQLFFGHIHDLAKEQLPGTIWVKYVFIIPFILIAFIGFTVYLKKSKRSFRQPGLFLNFLLLILIAIDCFSLVTKIVNSKQVLLTDTPANLNPCKDCPAPDIYMIVADEYPGQPVLNEFASFDNSPFINELKQRGFHVVDSSRANYNGTIYSLASMLGMGYLEGMQQQLISHPDMFSCRKLIDNNTVLDFLRKSGYRAINYSQFDFGGKDNFIPTHFFVSKSQFFTQNTFTSRIWKNTGYHFISKAKMDWGKKRHLRANEKVITATKAEAEKKPDYPRFIYSHLMMPHHPYYYNSKGVPYSIESLSQSRTNSKTFVEYLLYCNKRLLDLVDHLKSKSVNPPVILLVSDHGLRQFMDNSFNNYHFWNLDAVYLPDGNYKGFYNGMSNVNLFRVILNSQFRQNLPLLKDSTIVVWQPDMKNATED